MERKTDKVEVWSKYTFGLSYCLTSEFSCLINHHDTQLEKEKGTRKYASKKSCDVIMLKECYSYLETTQQAPRYN